MRLFCGKRVELWIGILVVQGQGGRGGGDFHIKETEVIVVPSRG